MQKRVCCFWSSISNSAIEQREHPVTSPMRIGLLTRMWSLLRALEHSSTQASKNGPKKAYVQKLRIEISITSCYDQFDWGFQIMSLLLKGSLGNFWTWPLGSPSHQQFLFHKGRRTEDAPLWLELVCSLGIDASVCPTTGFAWALFIWRPLKASSRLCLTNKFTRRGALLRLATSV